MADTFTCSGLMPHAFGKSATWLLDYVLKSPWPDGQGVGPLIQRLWVQVPLGILQQFSDWGLLKQSGAVASVLGISLDQNQALLFFLPLLQNGAHYGTSGHGRRYDTSGYGLRTRPSLVSVLAPASIAQLAARGSHNPKVVSSVLTGSTFCSLPPSLPMPLLIVLFRRMGLCSASAQRSCGLMDKAPLS